jgi:general secretion pathway protein H
MRMPTSGTEAARDARTAGFTLVELLAVLAILAIVVTAFSFSSGKSLDTAKFRALMVRTSAAIGNSRADAIRGMEEKVFYVDLKRRRMGYPQGGELLELPPGVDLTATVAESERYADGSLGIRFYPTGGSSGGTLAFSFRNQVYEIRVNWLTGNVSLHRV